MKINKMYIKIMIIQIGLSLSVYILALLWINPVIWTCLFIFVNGFSPFLIWCIGNWLINKKHKNKQPDWRDKIKDEQGLEGLLSLITFCFGKITKICPECETNLQWDELLNEYICPNCDIEIMEMRFEEEKEKNSDKN